MKNPEKLLVYLISGKNPITSAGGYANYSYSLAESLQNSGCIVETFCIGRKTRNIESSVGIINIVGMPSFFLSLFNGIEMAGLPFFAFAIALVILKSIKKQTPRIIWGVGPWSFAGAMLNYFSGKKTLIFVDYFTSIKHEFKGSLDAFDNADYDSLIKFRSRTAMISVIPVYSLLERFVLNNSDNIITHYESTERILTKQFGINKNKFIRLPYYISEADKPKTGKPFPKKQSATKTKNSLPLIVSLSRQDARKGINFLLHSLGILNKRGLKYSAVIAGGGTLLEANRRLAKKLGLNNVSFPGFVPSHNRTELLNQTSIFVLPSLEEGSGSIALLEAAQKGLPIVSTNVDGIPEELVNNYSALLVPPQNPKALADALEKLITNPALAKKLGREAKRQYKIKHNSRIVKRELKSLLRSFHNVC